MPFEAIIINRLGTEEAKATQAHLDVVVDVMNRIPKVPMSRFNDECLKAIEERCIEQPFPHDLRIGSLGAKIEDIVAYVDPMFLPHEEGRWLSMWVEFSTPNHREHSELYNAIRYWFAEDDEYLKFDLKCDMDTQTLFMLLAAHAHETRMAEEAKAIDERSTLTA